MSRIDRTAAIIEHLPLGPADLEQQIARFQEQLAQADAAANLLVYENRCLAAAAEQLAADLSAVVVAHLREDPGAVRVLLDEVAGRGRRTARQLAKHQIHQIN